MYKQSGFCHTKMSSSKVDHRKISAMILSLRKTITSRIQPKYSLGQSQYTCGQEQGVAIPNQNSAKLSVSPCFARVRFCSPVFCPFLPIFCQKMGKNGQIWVRLFLYKLARIRSFSFVVRMRSSPPSGQESPGWISVFKIVTFFVENIQTTQFFW